VVAFLFTFGTVGLLSTAVAALKGRTAGLLAGIVLVSTPYFIQQGATECADVPMSFFLLATLALLALQDRWPKARGVSALAGLSAGLAAWTKNEGLLLVAVVVLVRAAPWLGWRERGAALRQAGWFAAGLAPVLAVVMFFRHSFGTPNAIFSGRSALSMLALFTDWHRWMVLLKELFKESLGFGDLGIPLGVPVALAIYLACAGLDGDRNRTSVWTTFATLTLMLAGYCVVCVIAPYEIHWQVMTALRRLLLQLWPAALFLTFLVAARSIPAGKQTSVKH
jgi:4-amino-4-deoxy-L-arabinose transferase-like glycosyltransferase